MNRSTIAAIATPYGSGGIGIIRISGDASLKIAHTLFRRSGAKGSSTKAPQPETIQSHRMYHGYIVDPVTQERIDEILMVAMKGPKSYTREDVVELHSHAGYIVLSQILDKVLQCGARIAEPGEFTKRAFLNGRIDLTQAEAVCDIINAKTASALRLAVRQLGGRLKERLDFIRSLLSELRVYLEAAIDFPEDAEEIVAVDTLKCRLKTDVLTELEGLIEQYRVGHFYRDGVRMAVIGRPNVGKSSLLNRLIEKNRAIVSSLPGTTRDIIEETLNLEGVPVVVMDTAGLQSTQEEVERLGIEKTLASIEDADLILFVVDLSRGGSTEDERIYDRIKEKAHIVVQNKLDLIAAEGKDRIPSPWGASPSIAISALKGTHIDGLKRKIREIAVGPRDLVDESGVMPNARHIERLQHAGDAVRNALAEIENRSPAEILSLEIKEAMQHLDGITGDSYTEDLLDQIFGRFCIGK